MDQNDNAMLKAMAAELAKNIRSEKDLGALTQPLVKWPVEAALGAEMETHLGYEKHDPTGRGSRNSRNGTTSKRLKGQHGRSRFTRLVIVQAPSISSSSERDKPAPPDG